MTGTAASASPISLDALRLARPAQRALAAAGYAHLEQLAGVPEAELLQLHGMGPKALGLLREALAERRLALIMPDCRAEWPRVLPAVMTDR